jgi:hypothetical protein
MGSSAKMGAWNYDPCINLSLIVQAQSLIPKDLISFAEAAKELRDQPHPSTIWRWSLRGVRGVRLKSWLVGGRRYTTLSSLWEFIEATTAAADGRTAPALSTAIRTKEVDNARRELEEEGFF